MLCNTGRETSPGWLLSSLLKAEEDSTVERLIAESANDEGTVTERLLPRSKLSRLALIDWDSVLSSAADVVDIVAKLQPES